MTTAIESALRDPEGARRALFHYGGLWSWPMCKLGPIQMQDGAQGWLESLNAVEGLQLGLAWQASAELGQECPVSFKRVSVPRVSDQHGPEPIQRPEPAKEEKPVKLAWKEYSGLEPGIYPARIAEIIEQPAGERTPAMNFDPKDQFVFQFVILDNDGRDTVAQMRGYCNQTWGVKSKLLEWATVILKNKCPKAGEEFDTDLLLARKCDIQVEQEPNKAPKITRIFAYRSMSVQEEEDAFPAPKAKQTIGA